MRSCRVRVEAARITLFVRWSASRRRLHGETCLQPSLFSGLPAKEASNCSLSLNGRGAGEGGYNALLVHQLVVIHQLADLEPGVRRVLVTLLDEVAVSGRVLVSGPHR